jgi:hypothetical protein
LTVKSLEIVYSNVTTLEEGVFDNLTLEDLGINQSKTLRADYSPIFFLVPP